MGFSQIFSKFVLGLILVLLWAASACLIIVGAIVWHGAGKIDSVATSTYTLLPTVIIIAAGIFLFLLGVIGCFACINENRCLLSTFFIVLLLVLLGEISAATLGIIYHGDVRSAVSGELQREIGNYTTDRVARSELDLIQSEYRCCGVRNFSDWSGTDYWRRNNATVPASCCRERRCGDSPPSEDPRVYPRGCLAKLEADFAKYLGLVAAFALTLAILQMLGLLSACILMCRSQERMPYQVFGEPAGGRYV